MDDSEVEKEEVAASKPSAKNLRSAMERVFADMGGEQGMVAWIKQNTANERVFYRDIVPKLIPKESTVKLTDPEGGPATIRFVWEGGQADPAKLTEKDVDINSPVALVAESLDLDDQDE